MAIDPDRMRQVLEAFSDIYPDGSLLASERYLSFQPGHTDATLDADFTADELEAIAWWMRMHAAPSLTSTDSPSEGSVSPTQEACCDEARRYRSLYVLICALFGQPTHYPGIISPLALVQECQAKLAASIPAASLASLRDELRQGAREAAVGSVQAIDVGRQMALDMRVSTLEAVADKLDTLVAHKGAQP